jgi:hypothetical protein
LGLLHPYIDLIEHYQNYLENNTSIHRFLFYNCTYPWFGSRCEYRFVEPESYFSELVEEIFQRKLAPTSWNSSTLSCYTYLQCDRVGGRGQTPGACLDWREVCNGKIDCVDGGHDEELCWQLETNDCDDNTEFRCHNGLCIPLAFLRDDGMNADCLDRSDESLIVTIPTGYIGPAKEFLKECFKDPAFRCEDHMCHLSAYRNYTLVCGDGSCFNFAGECDNKRHLNFVYAFWSGTKISDDCARNIECFTDIPWQDYPRQSCTDFLIDHAKSIEQYCPKLIELPSMLFDHIRFVYTNNQSQVSKWSITLFILERCDSSRMIFI